MKSVVDCQGNFFFYLNICSEVIINPKLMQVVMHCKMWGSCVWGNCSYVHEAVNLNCKARNLHSKKLFVPFFHQCLDPVLYFGVHGLWHFVPPSGHVGIQGGEQLHLVHKQRPGTLRLIPSLLLTIVFVVS